MIVDLRLVVGRALSAGSRGRVVHARDGLAVSSRGGPVVVGQGPGELPRQFVTRKRAPAREGGRSDRVARWTFKVRDRCRLRDSARRVSPPTSFSLARPAGVPCPRHPVVSAPAT